MVGGFGKRRMQFAQVVATAGQAINFLGAHMRDQCSQFRVFVKEMRQIVGAVVGAQYLVFAVYGGRERTQQGVARVARGQRQSGDGIRARPFRRRRIRQHVVDNTVISRRFGQAVQQETGTPLATMRQYAVQCIQPLPGFRGPGSAALIAAVIHGR